MDAATVAALGVISVVMFVLTLVALPPIVAFLPENYFVRPRRKRREISFVNWVWIVGKNIVGVLFVIAGIAMLVLPGQGLLTILVGLMLINFPGKHRMERWLVSRPRLLASLNWLRERFDRQPLIVDENVSGDDGPAE